MSNVGAGVVTNNETSSPLLTLTLSANPLMVWRFVVSDQSCVPINQSWLVWVGLVADADNRSVLCRSSPSSPVSSPLSLRNWRRVIACGEIVGPSCARALGDAFAVTRKGTSMAVTIDDPRAVRRREGGRVALRLHELQVKYQAGL